VRDGEDQPETRYEAPSIEELREQAPSIAKRLDEVLAENARSGFRIRIRPHDLRLEPGPGLRDFEESHHEGVRRLLERMRDMQREVGPLPKEFRRAAPAAPRPLLGVEWDPPSDTLRAQLELATGGVVVRRVLPGTLAERMGMRRHDVLLELAGAKLSTGDDVRKALASVADGGTVKAVVVRRAKRLELSAKK
jgi:hypothetical protein